MTVSEFKRFFDRTISRGPDDSRIIDTGKGLLGFHRLAIMGLHPEGMQPFELDGSYVVCNGEIYCFPRLKKALYAKEAPGLPGMVGLLVLLFLSLMRVTAGTYSAFIYFQF